MKKNPNHDFLYWFQIKCGEHHSGAEHEPKVEWTIVAEIVKHKGVFIKAELGHKTYF